MTREEAFDKIATLADHMFRVEGMSAYEVGAAFASTGAAYAAAALTAGGKVIDERDVGDVAAKFSTSIARSARAMGARPVRSMDSGSACIH